MKQEDDTYELKYVKYKEQIKYKLCSRAVIHNASKPGGRYKFFM